MLELQAKVSFKINGIFLMWILSKNVYAMQPQIKEGKGSLKLNDNEGTSFYLNFPPTTWFMEYMRSHC